MELPKLVRSALKAVGIILDRVVVNASLFYTVYESVTDTLYGEDLLDFLLVFAVILD